MREIKSLFKKWPVLYRIMQKTYYGGRQILETRLLGTKLQECLWRTAHIYKGAGWMEEHRESIHHPHRQWLTSKISFYAPFENILEIGCSTGQNLYILANAFPGVKFHGTDINNIVIHKGQDWLREEKAVNIRLSAGRADNLEGFDDKSMDVVFTDALLLYIGPDKIEKVLKEMIRVAVKGLVFNEWHSESCRQGGAPYFYYDGHWVYNYKKLFSGLVLSENVRISRIPEEVWGGSGWTEFGSVIEVAL